MKQPTFHGRVLLPLSVFAEARAGDPLAMERILRYYLNPTIPSTAGFIHHQTQQGWPRAVGYK